ncbi:hypothetical protein [Arthrobacter sp. QXT-31]|uniref:hypothetical protein n=1 Tax=Arthrobacter sp. QXT-31 TaxID=1357915 RepID=UPI000971905B|nr:hypothetical protein [Arthrobacter sp. QXT-31]APX00464.1 hypothetical protein BWQ92_00810 [Arthrobacter sp. QXT-31]
MSIVYWVSVRAHDSGVTAPASFSTVLFYVGFIALLGLTTATLFPEVPGRQWLAPVCAGVWAAFTIMFWLSILTARSPSLSEFSGGLFGLGVVAFLGSAAHFGLAREGRRRRNGRAAAAETGSQA